MADLPGGKEIYLYKPGQPVWALIAGCPWWPAEIKSVDYITELISVVFLDNKQQQAKLPVKKVKLFSTMNDCDEANASLISDKIEADLKQAIRRAPKILSAWRKKEKELKEDLIPGDVVFYNEKTGLPRPVQATIVAIYTAESGSHLPLRLDTDYPLTLTDRIYRVSRHGITKFKPLSEFELLPGEYKRVSTIAEKMADDLNAMATFTSADPTSSRFGSFMLTAQNKKGSKSTQKQISIPDAFRKAPAPVVFGTEPNAAAVAPVREDDDTDHAARVQPASPVDSTVQSDAVSSPTRRLRARSSGQDLNSSQVKKRTGAAAAPRSAKKRRTADGDEILASDSDPGSGSQTDPPSTPAAAAASSKVTPVKQRDGNMRDFMVAKAPVVPKPKKTAGSITALIQSWGKAKAETTSLTPTKPTKTAEQPGATAVAAAAATDDLIPLEGLFNNFVRTNSGTIVSSDPSPVKTADDSSKKNDSSQKKASGTSPKSPAAPAKSQTGVTKKRAAPAAAVADATTSSPTKKKRTIAEDTDDDDFAPAGKRAVSQEKSSSSSKASASKDSSKAGSSSGASKGSHGASKGARTSSPAASSSKKTPSTPAKRSAAPSTPQGKRSHVQTGSKSSASASKKARRSEAAGDDGDDADALYDDEAVWQKASKDGGSSGRSSSPKKSPAASSKQSSPRKAVSASTPPASRKRLAGPATPALDQALAKSSAPAKRAAVSKAKGEDDDVMIVEKPRRRIPKKIIPEDSLSAEVID